MPNLSNNLSKVKKKTLKKKVKKTKPQLTKPTKKTNLPTKHSPIDYYNFLLTKAQNDWYDPNLGKKQKITACCKDCKVNAQVLNKSREQEIRKLVTSYQRVGDSLRKLLKPIK